MAEGVAVDPQSAGLLDHLVPEDVRQERSGCPFNDIHGDIHDFGCGADIHTFWRICYIVGAVKRYWVTMIKMRLKT